MWSIAKSEYLFSGLWVLLLIICAVSVVGSFFVCLFFNMTNMEPQRPCRINKRNVRGLFLIENFLVMISRLGNFYFTKRHYKGSGCLSSSWENN